MAVQNTPRLTAQAAVLRGTDLAVTQPDVAAAEVRAYTDWRAGQADLASRQGPFVAVCGDCVVGSFASPNEAERRAYEQLGRRQIYLFEIGATAPPPAEVF